MNEFKKGIEKIVKRTPAPVIPLALKGLWGSWFSRKNGPAMSGIPKKFMAKIELLAGEAIAAEDVSSELLFDKVNELVG
jgi:1-acyl-sn-glycerol-3-phosphate acyltransferase